MPAYNIHQKSWRFDWPQKKHYTMDHPTSTDQVVTSVKNIVTSLVTNEANTTSNFGITDSPSSSTLTEITAITESVGDNSNIVTIMSDVADTVGTTMRNMISSVLKETGITISTNNNASTGTNFNTPTIYLDTNATSNSTTMLNANEKSNSTILTELIQSNNTDLTAIENTTADSRMVTTILSEPITNVDTVTDAIKTVVNSVGTTTENVLKKFTGVSTTDRIHAHQDHTDIAELSSTVFIEDLHTHNHHHTEVSELTSSVYVILGVIIALLIIIILSLVLIYKKYRKGNIHARSGEYCVTQLKEVSSSSEKTNECNVMNEKL